ncbi:hypothetical protein QBC40DRAFT_269184 [Triangularia verruculosa]|uniref:Uncharacterized protein n=1 Tax=Triangularia verruculosa TaxID=2587418 RepID=A0AAN6X8E6_9PEZI|nr:hypothetical protein QBC40DRAFT_269184 [Triangularia verruculosa]
MKASAPVVQGPWTAKQCHRLLRPLLAHIAALRKVKERKTSLSGIFDPISQPNQATRGRPRKSVVLGKRDRGYPESDEEYSAKKKVTRKYSRRSLQRSSAEDSSSTTTTPPRGNAVRQRNLPEARPAQDTVLPTPHLRRIRNHEQSSPVIQESAIEPTACGHSKCWKKCQFDRDLALLRSVIHPERLALFYHVVKALDSLLKKTRPEHVENIAAPRSLLAMCLRKIPDYISWEKKETEKDEDSQPEPQDCGVSFEIYDELESLGPTEGWKNLCLVVRAHSIQIVHEAAEEGLFDDRITILLIHLCHEYLPNNEFMPLIDTFIFRQYPRPSSTDNDFDCAALKPLRILKILGDATKSDLAPKKLASLLSDGYLPSEWILTEGFRIFWYSTMPRLAQMKPCDDVVVLATTALSLLCDLASPTRPRGVDQTRIRGKPQNQLINTVGALGAVVLLSQEGKDLGAATSSPADRTSVIRRRVQYIVENCTKQLRHRKKDGRKLGTYLFALCSFLCVDTSTSTAVIESSWRGVLNCKGNASLMLQYDATIALVVSIVKHCVRGTKTGPSVYLLKLCDNLQKLDLPKGALSSMRVDAAFRVAEVTGNMRDHAFAESLRKKTLAAATPDPKGGKKADFSGIRWDDVISEWVAATPGTAKGKKAAHQLRSTGLNVSDSEEESQEEDDDEDKTSDENEVNLEDPAELDNREPELPDLPSATEDSMEQDTTPDSASASEDEDVFSPDTEPSPHRLPGASPNNDDDDKENLYSENDFDQPPSPPKSTSSIRRGFLSARPRRLSRPITRGGDELTMDIDDDNDNNISPKQRASREATATTWLKRNKPARFRPARPSRVSLGVGDSAADDSDDELSIL